MTPNVVILCAAGMLVSAFLMVGQKSLFTTIRLYGAQSLLLATVACGETSRRLVRVDEDLYDPNPSRRLAAVEAARASGSRRHVPTLIEMLDDDDGAVRLAAGRTLTELTGRDTGYVAWADPAERQGQVAAWRAWWAGSGAGGGVPAAGGTGR